MNWINRTLLIALLIAPLSCGDDSPILAPVQAGYDLVSGTPFGEVDRLVIVEEGGVQLTFNLTRQTIVFRNLNDAVTRVRVRNTATAQIVLDNQNLPGTTDVISGKQFAEGDVVRLEVWIGTLHVAQSYLGMAAPDAEGIWQLGG